MSLYQLAGDGQAQPGAAGSPVPGRVNPVETVKHIGQRFRRNARPGVRHRNSHPLAVPDGGNGHRSAGRRMSQGVVRQIAQRLLNPQPVNVKRRQAGSDFGHQTHGARLGAGPERRRHPFHQVARRCRPHIQAQFPRLALRQQTQVINQPRQVAGLPVQRLQRGVIGRYQPILDGLNVALNVGQRRPQLVGYVRHQAAALALGVLQRFGHRVEGVPQLGDFIAAFHLYAARQIAAAQSAGGGGQAANRPQSAAGQQNHQENAGHARRQAGNGKGIVDRLGELRQTGFLGAGGRIGPFPRDHQGGAHPVVAIVKRREFVRRRQMGVGVMRRLLPPVVMTAGQPGMAPLPAVPHHIPLGVQNHHLPPRQQPGPHNELLHPMPVARAVVKTRQLRIQTPRAHPVLMRLDAVHLPLRHIAREQAHRPGGQRQNGDKAHRQPQPQAEFPVAFH